MSKVNIKSRLAKSVIFALLGLVCFVALVRVAGIVRQSQTQNSETTSLLTSANPLGYIARVETSKGTIYVLMTSEYVSFNPYETAVNNDKMITLKKSEYPKLFEQGIANSNVLQVVEYIDPQSGEVFVELSNNQPDHGGYASTYVLLVDPFTGAIKEGLNDYSKLNE